ncbi:hypothetical protein ACLF9S_02610 [Helicobacter pylori]
MEQSLLKKIGLGVGGFVVLMALGLLANKGSNNNNKEEIFQVSESKFPLSDYFFEEVKEEPKEKAKETLEVLPKSLQHKLAPVLVFQLILTLKIIVILTTILISKIILSRIYNKFYKAPLK